MSPLDGGCSDGQGRAVLHHNSPSCFPGLVCLLSEGGQGAAKHFDPVMTSIMSPPEELEKTEIIDSGKSLLLADLQSQGPLLISMPQSRKAVLL